MSSPYAFFNAAIADWTCNDVQKLNTVPRSFPACVDWVCVSADAHHQWRHSCMCLRFGPLMKLLAHSWTLRNSEKYTDWGGEWLGSIATSCPHKRHKREARNSGERHRLAPTADETTHKDREKESTTQALDAASARIDTLSHQSTTLFWIWDYPVNTCG